MIYQKHPNSTMYQVLGSISPGQWFSNLMRIEERRVNESIFIDRDQSLFFSK
jgi:hypothetical protein